MKEVHKITRIFLSSALMLILSTQALAEEKRWVTSDGTTLKAAASAAAEDVAPLPVGTEVSVVESGGRWLKARSASGKEGWVYAGRVSDTQPATEVSGGDGGLFGDTMQSSQINTAKADSARSIRGLSPEVDQYAKQRGTPAGYKKALDKVLERSVSRKDVKAFLREGKIGEFAQ